MTRTVIALLFAAVVSFSLYLTPTPISRKSVSQFLQFFLLTTVFLVGISMTVPFFMGWILPFQQGLGSNSSLLFRGIFLSLVCLFCIIVTKLDAEPFLWIKPILLLLVGFSELFRLLDFLNSAVNGMLNQSDMPIRSLYSLIYPYLILLTTDIALMALGSVLIIFNIVGALKRA